jgi:hypothetical protein
MEKHPLVQSGQPLFIGQRRQVDQAVRAAPGDEISHGVGGKRPAALPEGGIVPDILPQGNGKTPAFMVQNPASHTGLKITRVIMPAAGRNQHFTADHPYLAFMQEYRTVLQALALRNRIGHGSAEEQGRERGLPGQTVVKAFGRFLQRRPAVSDKAFFQQ